MGPTDFSDECSRRKVARPLAQVQIKLVHGLNGKLGGDRYARAVRGPHRLMHDIESSSQIFDLVVAIEPDRLHECDQVGAQLGESLFEH